MKALAKDDAAPKPGYNNPRFAKICRYRAKNGESCLIGCFISDELYTLDIEGFSVRSLRNVGSKFIYKSGLWDWTPGTDFYESKHLKREEFLSNLQRCHDSADTLPEMMQNLANFAQRYNLTIPAHYSILERNTEYRNNI